MISPHNLLDCRQLCINTSYLLLLMTASFHWGCLIRNRNSLLFARNWVHPQFILVGSVFLIFFVLCYVVICLFVYLVSCCFCLRPVSFVPNASIAFGLSILDCVFSFLYPFFHAWLIGHYCAVRREHSTYEILIK